MSTNRPIPQSTPETEPFWSATLAGRLVVKHCRTCGEDHFYPRLVCPSCMSLDLEWKEVSGRGTVYSFTVVERAPAAFAEIVPYVVGLVQLAEGPRMMSWIKTAVVSSVQIGMPVRVSFEKVSDSVALPVFVPEAS